MKLLDLQNIRKAMKKAREMSFLSNHHQTRVGAVVMVKNQIISSGFNQDRKTHPFIGRHGLFWIQSIHAEMSAIFRLKNKTNLKGSTMVVYRETRDGHLAMSRPCETCQKLLRKYGVKRIQYTTVDGIKEELL